MLTKTTDVREIQTNLQDLLSLVRKGAEVILTEGTTPLARLAPIALPTILRMAGLHAGAIWTSEDFDEPLLEEIWMETTGNCCWTRTLLSGGTVNQPSSHHKP